LERGPEASGARFGQVVVSQWVRRSGLAVLVGEQLWEEADDRQDPGKAEEPARHD
jgi:hypothetical protein